MVMIMFKSVAEGKSGNGIPFEKDRENQGRKLLRKYARRQENLTLEAGGLSEEEVCDLALGAELEDYCFDKYDNKPASSYPRLESITLRVGNPLAMRLAYEPYAALANAVRFARNLFNEPESLYQTEQYFFEIKRLEYLGLYFKDLGEGLVMLEWKGAEDAEPVVLVATDRKAAAVGAGVMKAAALQKLPGQIRAYLKIEGILNDFLIKNPIYIKQNLQNDAAAAEELRRLYGIIREKHNA